MAGTKEGARKARETNYKTHGPDFYRRIGSKGGQNGKGPNYFGGFAANPELARKAGAKGGRISRRGPAGTRKKEKEFIWRPGDAMFSK